MARKIIPILGCVSLLSGCAKILDPDNPSWFKDDQISLVGTKQVIRKDALATVSLVPLICVFLPEKDVTLLRKEDGAAATNCADASETEMNLNQALAAFSKAYTSETPAHGGGWKTATDLTTAKARAAQLSALAGAIGADLDAAKSAVDAAQRSFTAALPLIGKGDALVASLTKTAWTEAVTSATDAKSAATNAKAEADAAMAEATGTKAANRVAAAAESLASAAIAAATTADQAGYAAGNEADLAKSFKDGTLPASLGQGIKDAEAARQASATASNRSNQTWKNASGGAVGGLYRSNIQNRIKMAADRRCEIYKSVLSSAKAEKTFFSGLAAAVVGVTGGLVSDTASRYFSAAAGGIAGGGAAFDSAVFQGQAIDLVTYGIDVARSEWQRNIFDAKRDLPLKDYGLEDAIGHAIQYNGHCTMATALHYVADKLTQKPDVGQIINEQLMLAAKQQCNIKAMADSGAARLKSLKACNAEVEEYSKLLGASSPQPQAPKPAAAPSP